FIPQIAWDSQRDLTHSVLASTLTMATLFAFFRLGARRTTLAYVAFGLCAGLGMLAKFNYLLFFFGLLLAALSLRQFRAVVLDRKMLLAVFLILILFTPTGLWILDHRDLTFQSSFKFAVNQSHDWFSGVCSGLLSVAKCTATFLGPLTLAYLLIFRKK